ncbi:MAG: Crp/Fnr family transcriptional regulator [Anaerolineales bacterium]|nr:Crp/Fnr family transcriptional regulator [Anaerolineales bacterium]
MSHLADLLSEAEVFNQLTGKERQEVSRLAVRRSLKKGDVLCRQGDDWPYVLYIVSGALRSVINSPDGRSYVVSLWEKGEVFWAHTIFDQNPMPSTLEAARVTHLYQWTGEDVLQIVLHNQTAIRALLRRQTSLIRKRRESIYNLAFNPVASRLAKLIIEKFIASDVPTVQRDLTLSDMAEMVASSPEVVCRLLYQFQDSGAIVVKRASITLQDRKALESLIVEN